MERALSQALSYRGPGEAVFNRGAVFTQMALVTAGGGEACEAADPSHSGTDVVPWEAGRHRQRRVAAGWFCGYSVVMPVVSIRFSAAPIHQRLKNSAQKRRVRCFHFG